MAWQKKKQVRGLNLGLSKKRRTKKFLKTGERYSQSRTPGLSHVDLHNTVKSGGIDIHTYVVGPRSVDKPEATVVFIHGFTLAAEVYYMQVDFLETYFPQIKSVLIDARGHGATGPVAPERCTVTGTADDVVAAINAHATNGPLILVGHSLGGLTALNLIKRAPAALRERIVGLVLVATSIESLSAQGLPQVLASPIADNVKNAAEAAPEDAQKFREYATKFLAPALATAVFQRDTSSDVINFHAAMIHETPLDTFVGFFDDLQEHDELDAAPALKGLEGYVLAGEKDDVTPISQANRICELWPEAKLQVAAGAGHMLPLEAPAILNNALAALLEKQGITSTQL
ncbi:alpha/beta fold hydrolase [Corynebacterium callunae]|uniref:Hydrolase/acyltransferase n=1 Tax=Corynebacterium callunae DSM 20147 TaxID=1121353 RepID=M1UMD8_9CORY|nr:alpha/beta hydrolase [Corynebacterium callunae]AGG67334.1 hydrolase/acyltransferase [Corynebacterium callunae DSM 20147]